MDPQNQDLTLLRSSSQGHVYVGSRACPHGKEYAFPFSSPPLFHGCIFGVMVNNAGSWRHKKPTRGGPGEEPGPKRNLKSTVSSLPWFFLCLQCLSPCYFWVSVIWSSMKSLLPHVARLSLSWIIFSWCLYNVLLRDPSKTMKYLKIED